MGLHETDVMVHLCRALECTGTLIGTRHVLTAGHCVYDIHSTHKMVSSLDFAPGMNGHGKPNGVVQWQNVRILSQFQSQVTHANYMPFHGSARDAGRQLQIWLVLIRLQLPIWYWSSHTMEA